MMYKSRSSSFRHAIKYTLLPKRYNQKKDIIVNIYIYIYNQFTFQYGVNGL